ncbi:MAG: DnaJ domain-containing protein [Bacteroidota bacterium]
MALKNYYIILGVPATASQEDIKQAYRRLAKQFHPDINPGDQYIEERFKEISEAYTTLSDEELRRKYDMKFLYARNAESSQRTGAERKARPRYRRKPDAPLTRREKRAIFIMLTAGISFVTFMAVMSFFIPEYDEAETLRQILAHDKFHPRTDNHNNARTPLITTSDSPYEAYFGGDVDSEDSRGNISVENNLTHAAVVCLVEAREPHRTIRNEYIEPGGTYRFTAIPAGTYYIKAYFGNIWQPLKKMHDGTVTGGFEKESGFFKSDDPKNLYHISQDISGDNLVYRNYEILLSKVFDDKKREISPEEFFRK